MARQHDVTGRDGHILAQALGYFVALQEALPPDQRDYSNLHDAARIATSDHVSRSMVAIELAQARRKIALLQGRPEGPVTLDQITQEIGEADAQLDRLAAGEGFEWE